MKSDGRCFHMRQKAQCVFWEMVLMSTLQKILGEMRMIKSWAFLAIKNKRCIRLLNAQLEDELLLIFPTQRVLMRQHKSDLNRQSVAECRILSEFSGLFLCGSRLTLLLDHTNLEYSV